MRLLAAVLAGTLLGFSTFALADDVTFRVTEDATGTYGNQTFTNVPLTLSLTYNAYELSQAILFGYYGPNDFQFGQLPNTSTLSIAGVGTFQMDLGVNSVYEGAEIYEEDDVGNLGLMFDLTVPNFQQSVGPVTQTIGYTDPTVGCVPDIHSSCPPFFYTGLTPPVYVTSLGGTWTQEFIVGSSAPAPTPEPSSLLLFGTGILAMGLLMRRRFLPS
ncbi:PEP-CTERM sorting domain-containing protein [Granulicella sp. S190]|uniref:PEP-CTERM sorting domain-containing protein n=1 Tax=Granulicella sp. S190 TaxID=1747226 RepID=UPI00131D1D1A|nr:PEP-CTERM sorting domain-containing protein [Granulicella sp. S190]